MTALRKPASRCSTLPIVAADLLVAPALKEESVVVTAPGRLVSVRLWRPPRGDGRRW